MPFVYPTADVTVSGWTNAKASTSPIYTSVNEVIRNDATFARIGLPSSGLPNPVANEDSRSAYTTTLGPSPGTACTRINAHALGTVDLYHNLIMIVPNSVNVNNFTPIVVALHGVGSFGANFILPTGGKFGTNGMTDTFLDNGFVVIGLAHGSNESGTPPTWGNDSSRDGQIDVWTWASSIFASPGFLLYGTSMGGCAALNYLLEIQHSGGTIPVIACALNSAATNFKNTYDNGGTTGLIGGMRTAYGLGTVSSSDPTYIAAVNTDRGGHDPNVVGVTGGTIPTIPFRFYVAAGTGDTTIPPAQNSNLYNTALTSASWVPEHTIVAINGATHASDNTYLPADCLQFYQRAMAL